MSKFNELMKELVSRNSNLYMGKTNSPLPTENVTCYMIPGSIGSLTDNKRQANMLITFDSVSDDYDNAYNNLLSIQEEILQNTDYYDSVGFEFNVEIIEEIDDISYIEVVEYLYRFIFSIEVFYFREVI